MKNKNMITYIVIAVVVLIALFALYQSTNAPDETSENTENSILYIGLPLEQAQMLAVKNSTTLRAVTIDGEPQATTRDYRIGRINADVVDGVVSDFTIEGETSKEEPSENTQTPTDYIGLSVEDAIDLAAQNETEFRVVSIDGEAQIVTEDLRIGRINASSVDGIITEYDVEGSDFIDEASPEETESYIGMSVVNAAELAEEKGDIFRVVNIDGEPQPVTMDYVVGRINVSIVDGRVTEFYIEGE